MSHFIDDVARILAGPASRRETLRLLGIVALGAFGISWKQAQASPGQSSDDKKGHNCGDQNCNQNQTCCTNGSQKFCINQNRTCCGGDSCGQNQTCCTNGSQKFCINQNRTCCGGDSCNQNQTCCGNRECCGPNQTCNNGRCAASRDR